MDADVRREQGSREHGSPLSGDEVQRNEDYSDRDGGYAGGRSVKGTRNRYPEDDTEGKVRVEEEESKRKDVNDPYLFWHDFLDRNSGSPLHPPETLLGREVTLRRWDAAFECVQHFGLDVDVVYKAQWNTCNVVSEETVREYLSKVRDAEWVLDVCLNTAYEGPEEAKVLLRHGLKVTDTLSPREVIQEINSVSNTLDLYLRHDYSTNTSNTTNREVARMCWFRLVFLRNLARLETHRAIYADVYRSSRCNDFFASTFAEFCDMDIVLLATQFAVKGQHNALGVLLKRHGDDLLPFRLSLLSLLPSTLDPLVYRRILPGVNSRTGCEATWQSIPWSRRDWSETAEFMEFAGLRPPRHILLSRAQELKGTSSYIDYLRADAYYWSIVEGYESRFNMDIRSDPRNLLSYTQVDTLGLETAPYPLSAIEVSEWYSSRASAIESESGLTVRAVDLLRIARRNSVPGLNALYYRYKVLAFVLYDCDLVPGVDEEVDTLGVGSIEEMAPSELLQLQFRRVSPESVEQRMERVLTPYIQVLITGLKERGLSTHEAVKYAETCVGDFVVSLSQGGRIEVCIRMLEAISHANSGYEMHFARTVGIDDDYNDENNNDGEKGISVDTKLASKHDPKLITLFEDFNIYCSIVLRCAYSVANTLADLTTLQRLIALVPNLAERVASNADSEHSSAHNTPGNRALPGPINDFQRSVATTTSPGATTANDTTRKPTQKKTKTILVRKQRTVFRNAAGDVVYEKPRVMAELQVLRSRRGDMHSVMNSTMASPIGGDLPSGSLSNALHSLQAAAGSQVAGDVINNLFSIFK